MELLLQSAAVARVDQMFGCGEAHEQPADLIADIMQFCIYNDIDFDQQLTMAREYVAEELMIDADTDEQILTNLQTRR